MTSMGKILECKTKSAINSDFRQVLSGRDANPVTHPGVKGDLKALLSNLTTLKTDLH